MLNVEQGLDDEHVDPPPMPNVEQKAIHSDEEAVVEAVMAEARSQQAASMIEFHWLGHRFPISNAKTRVAILKELDQNPFRPSFSLFLSPALSSPIGNSFVSVFVFFFVKVVRDFSRLFSKKRRRVLTFGTIGIMPVSGQEETGVKSIAGQFSGFIAGVPIKKRRFPIFRPSSPLSEDSSIPEENELLRKELSSTSQGLTLSNASIAGAPIKKRRFPLIQASSSSLEEPCSLPEENDASRKEHSSTSQGSTLSTSSSGLSESNRNSVFEEGKASSDVTDPNKVQSNSNFLVPKLEEPEPGLATPSCTSDVMESKDKVALKEAYGEKVVSKMFKGKSELLLAAKEGLALNIGAHINKQNVQEKIKQECPVVPESTDLSLGLKEHLFSTLFNQDTDESCQREEKTDSVSLKLSLSEEVGTIQRNDDVKSDSDRAHVHSNRANWDLNTTMDAWEESVADAASGKTSNVLKSTDTALDENHFMCSAGIPTTSVASVKKTHVETKNRAVAISSALYGQQSKSGDPCNLRLFSSGLQKYAEEPFRLSVKLNSGSVIPTENSSSVVASGGDLSMASSRTVKSEPFDENPKQNLKKFNPSPIGSLDGVAVKHELVERSNVEAFNSSKGSNLKLVDAKFVKSEPGHEGNQERPKTTEVKSDQVSTELLQGFDNCSALPLPTTMETTPISAETECTVEKPICSADLSTSGNVVNHLESSHSDEKESLGACPIAEQVPTETEAVAMVDNGPESSVPDMKDDLRTERENADDAEGCRLKLMSDLPLPDPRGSGEGCVSDDEKITLSADMLEDDSYGSDYESDDNHALTIAMDTEQYAEDDDYEDGEVREPMKHSSAEDAICEVREVERVDHISYENKQMESGGLVCGDYPTSSNVEEGENTIISHSEVTSGKDGVDTEISEKYDKVTEKNVCLQESLDSEKPTVHSDGKRPAKTLRRKSSDISDMESVPKASESEFSHKATNGSLGVDVAQYTDEVVKTTDVVRKAELDLQKIEPSENFDDATKDINNGANQGRIIDLSRAASVSSPSKARPMSGRSLPSRAGRDILSDTLDGDKLNRGRDEIYIDGPHKFSKERNQDLSPRNTRLSFGRGRGRGSRLESFRGNWESDREFTDGSFVGTGRVGRKPLNDEGPLCRHIPSRRRSPGGRDVATGRSIQMGHRIPRNMSPSRCIGGGDGSELVGMRHGDKFMRGFPDDPMDPVFSRPQPFEGMESRYTRGGRSSFMQRRGLPRIRSKSPIRSRSRSPGPWTSPRRRSPRRRSPDGFGGHPEMTHRRSALYRTDRMRSPDRPVFTGERVVRRHGSPSYMPRPSNDIRDMESGREHVHPRSVMSNRSPSGRILLRNNRRFDVVDRGDNEDYFGGPMHSGGRILELNGEGNGDERRRFGERRGPVRSFRPPYNGNVGENFHLNAEDAPRHYRFCADDDSEFHERNLRERDFDRRIKTRPANVPPRRTRNIDEQEGNYRHGGGQVWNDEGYDDISRVKRKRF
ncbi:hypothetical protein L6164_005739 [Bauhinia variegata]|uniref:Uncharacterized protein n=1 Tax=Bauhinia variegata TaxID=167791 RepID=A0ACB9PS25_BAUVA|nr:hypothetical protein L6164_005739 [Bauhinia variegata]